MRFVWGTGITLKENATAVEDIMTPEGPGSVTQDMGIVTLGVEGDGIGGRDTTREALPRIASREVGSVGLVKDDLLARVDGGRVR